MNWNLKSKPDEKEDSDVVAKEPAPLDKVHTLQHDDCKVSQTSPDNPYIYFLDAVSGEQEDKSGDQGSGSGLLGGLQSWLGFAGSLGGAEMSNLTNLADNSTVRWMFNSESTKLSS